MPYLVCDKCNTYYKLKNGESAKDFPYCECGNKLKYYKYIGDYTQRSEDPDISTRNENVGKSKGIKLISILAVLGVIVLLIAGVSAIFSNGEQANKPTLIVLYAPWCSACDKYEQTLSDQEVKEKINKNYNFQKVNVDWNADMVKKYAVNGQVLLPTTIVLDANGSVIKRHEGYMTPDQLMGFLTP